MIKLLLAAALVAAAKENKPVEPMEWKGQFCAVSAAEHVVVETPKDWEKLWKDIGKPAPQADFSKHFAVAVFLGHRRTGGYSVRWEEPKAEKGTLTVRYAVAPPEGMAMQALTQPWDVRLFNKAKGKEKIVVELKP